MYLQVMRKRLCLSVYCLKSSIAKTNIKFYKNYQYVRDGYCFGGFIHRTCGAVTNEYAIIIIIPKDIER